MAAAIAIVGRSESGKTTFLEKLLPELKRRGYRLATLKHAQEVHLDAGKDSARHLKAGAEETLVVAPEEMVLIRPLQAPATPEEALRLLGNDFDLVICEGFKQSSLPKIEIHRRAAGPVLEGLTSLVATVTDEPLAGRARQFSFDQVKELADFIENGYIKPQQESFTLYVNGAPLPLIQFPRQMLHDTLVGMVSALKGVGPIRRLEVFLRHSPEKKG